MLLCEGFTYIYIFHCTCVSHGGIISTNLLQLFLLCWDRRERSFQLWYSLPCRLQAAVQFLCLSYNRKFKHICKLLPGVIFFVRCSFPLNRIVLADEWMNRPDFCRAACCVYCSAVCSSDFSETKIPMVWMWTWGQKKNSSKWIKQFICLEVWWSEEGGVEELPAIAPAWIPAPLNISAQILFFPLGKK